MSSLLQLPSLQEVEDELAYRHLNHFIRHLWSTVETDTYLSNWHQDAICAHLDAVLKGTIRRLIINIPPRCMKSLAVSVFFPAWAWLRYPQLRFLFSSYAHTLSIRDSVKCRRVMSSVTYQRLMMKYQPKLRLSDDQNAKERYDNSMGGYRLATSVGGSNTGEGGDIIGVDDPNNVVQSESETIREGTNQWWDEAMSTRLNDPKTGRYIIIMQRTHTRDLTGHILTKQADLWDHLCLPAEYEGDRVISSLDYVDPRTTFGESLWPARLTPEVLAGYKSALTSYAYAGQFQQRPAPRDGGMFNTKKILLVDHIKESDIIHMVRYWDKAGCLVAGSIINTQRGLLPIEYVQEGDHVWTRLGWRRVKWAGRTGVKQKLVTALFSDGSVLTGTPDHPLLTTRGNWLTIGTIKGKDRFQIWQTNEIPPSRSLSTTESGTPGSKVSGTIKPGSGTKKKGSTKRTPYTGPSGGPFTEVFPLALISTTRTVTGITTHWTILNALPEVNICSDTGKSFKHQSTGDYSKKYANWPWSVSLNTSRHRKAKVIAVNGDCLCGKGFPPELLRALNVETCLNIERLAPQYIVLGGVKIGQVIGGAEVFDIEVEDQHEFRANGLIVHNTKGGEGAQTAGVKMGKLRSGMWGVLDVVTGRWEAGEREAMITRTAQADGQKVRIYVEQEPGSGGKESAQYTTRRLAGFRIRADRPTGDKTTRAEPFSDQVYGGNVVCLRRGWTTEYLDELKAFPRGALRDQVDASSGAFAKLRLIGSGVVMMS